VDRIIGRLEAAQTSAEERDAFLEIQQDASITRRFRAFDDDGAQLFPKTLPSWEPVHTILLDLNEQTVEHVVIDTENLDILVRE